MYIPADEMLAHHGHTSPSEYALALIERAEETTEHDDPLDALEAIATDWRDA